MNQYTYLQILNFRPVENREKERKKEKNRRPFWCKVADLMHKTPRIAPKAGPMNGQWKRNFQQISDSSSEEHRPGYSLKSSSRQIITVDFYRTRRTVP